MNECRLCGVESHETYYNLSDPELLLEVKLEKVFSVKLSKAKFFSQKVCFDCIKNLQSCESFLQTIQETQESFASKQYDESAPLQENIKVEVIEILLDKDFQSELISDAHEANERSTKILNLESGSSGSNRLKVEDIFVNELQHGVFEYSPETLSLSSSEKNPNGTINEAGERTLAKLGMFGWSRYAWKCPECTLYVDSRRSLEEHFKTDHGHGKVSYACMDCHLCFKSYFSFQNHVIDTHKPHLKFSCDVCSEFRWNLLDLYKHRQQLHPKYRNCCLYCGRLFDCGFNLKQHVAVHMKFKDDELFYCDICSFQAHTKFLIRQHLILSHSKSRPELICEQCGKICKRSSDMRSHQLVHTTERPFSCDLCDLKFKCKKQLRSHKKTHFATIWKVECSVCFKKFMTQSKLSRHSKMHTNEYAFTCEFCGRKFKYASGFETHRRIHTGERPYVCSFNNCNQKFIDWPNMNKHMKNKHSIDNSTRKKKIYLDQVPPNALL